MVGPLDWHQFFRNEEIGKLWIHSRKVLNQGRRPGGVVIVTWLLLCENPKRFGTKISDAPNPFGSRLANKACGANLWNPSTAPNR